MNYKNFNYHITDRCNFHCQYCFGKFIGRSELPLEDAKKIVDNMYAYFLEENIPDGKINFAGGEPLLYPYLDELVLYAHSLGIKVSLVTNGSLLTSKRIRLWCGIVDCIGISIDSLSSSTNCSIGRCDNQMPQNTEQLVAIAKVIHECGIQLKINTVVSQLNLNEDFSQLYIETRPERIKIFQMHLVKGINDGAREFAVTKEEFEEFRKRHQYVKPAPVFEPEGTMENSYLMINPEGFFQLNDNGTYRTLGDCKTQMLCEIVKGARLDEKKYAIRYTET